MILDKYKKIIIASSDTKYEIYHNSDMANMVIRSLPYDMVKRAYIVACEFIFKYDDQKYYLARSHFTPYDKWVTEEELIEIVKLTESKVKHINATDDIDITI